MIKMDYCSFDNGTMLTVAQALEHLAQTIKPIGQAETIIISEAIGRIAAKPVYSPINLPFETNAAMDGYALNSKDIQPNQPFSLRQCGTSWAGKPFNQPINTGSCVRIFTGAVVPKGADTVIMQEQTRSDGDMIFFQSGILSGQNIRRAGEDIPQNGLLLAEGKQLTPMDIALLASAGIPDISVKRCLKIAYFSTGDELTSVGEPLQSGNIYESNRYSLAGLLKNPFFECRDLGTIPDNKEAIKSILLPASRIYDVIISTGGASVGEADFITAILNECGRINFWKIAIKPGKPLAFGTIGQSYFFGLPGNPVSVFVTFQQIVEPALRCLIGATPTKKIRLLATCTTGIAKHAGREEYQRGILTQDRSGKFWVEPSGKQGSHILGSFRRSQCYIVLPSDCQGVNPGDSVIVEPYELFI